MEHDYSLPTHSCKEVAKEKRGTTMSRIYHIDDARVVRERQRALPKGTVAEVWPDVFEEGSFWVSGVTKQLLEGDGPPLASSVSVEGSRVPIYFPEEPRDGGSLPSEESLRVRVLAGHGVAVTWYGATSPVGARPLPEPTSPEDAFFYLMKMGGRVNHAWRLFRTREDAVDFMTRFFPDDPRGKAWAEALPVARFSELLQLAA